MRVESIKNIAVVGAGTMGQGIAQACAQAGYAVMLYDTQPDITTFTFADQTRNIHLCTWFCKWKERWTKPDLDVVAIHFLCKMIYGLFQIGKAYIPVYIEPFHLVEETVCPC